MSKEFGATWAKYNDLAAKAKDGDKAAKIEKAKVMNDIRQMERESAREGRVLNAVTRAGGRVEVQVTETDSKRSMQEGACRDYDNEIPVEVENRRSGEKFVGTLQAYHRKRLFGK